MYSYIKYQEGQAKSGAGKGPEQCELLLGGKPLKTDPGSNKDSNGYVGSSMDDGKLLNRLS